MSSSAGARLDGEVDDTEDYEVAVHWSHEYARQIRTESAALADLLERVEDPGTDTGGRAILDEQNRLLHSIERLLARLRFWNDRETALAG